MCVCVNIDVLSEVIVLFVVMYLRIDTIVNYTYICMHRITVALSLCTWYNHMGSAKLKGNGHDFHIKVLLMFCLGSNGMFYHS